MATESKIKADIFKKLGGRPDVRLFRNNVGMAYMGTVSKKSVDCVTIKNYRVVKFGLFKGSGDLIGWKTTTITQDMVGKKIAQFLSVEVKRPHGRRRPDQALWAYIVGDMGGIAIFAESVDSAEI